MNNDSYPHPQASWSHLVKVGILILTIIITISVSTSATSWLIINMIKYCYLLQRLVSTWSPYHRFSPKRSQVTVLPKAPELSLCSVSLFYIVLERYWKSNEILENIPALISHKMCLTDGKLRCAIKIGSDSITELVPMHSRVRKMESQCDNCKYIWQIQIRLFITKHTLELAKNGKPEWLSPHPQLG